MALLAGLALSQRDDTFSSCLVVVVDDALALLPLLLLATERGRDLDLLARF